MIKKWLLALLNKHVETLFKVQKKYKNIKKIKTKNGKIALSSKCAVCGSKKSKFMKEQEAEGLLSKLGIKTTLSKIPLLNVLF